MNVEKEKGGRSRVEGGSWDQHSSAFGIVEGTCTGVSEFEAGLAGPCVSLGLLVLAVAKIETGILDELDADATSECAVASRNEFVGISTVSNPWNSHSLNASLRPKVLQPEENLSIHVIVACYMEAS